MYPYAPPPPYPYAYPPPMMHGRNDEKKKQMMLALVVAAGVGYWYYSTHYKSPTEMMKHLAGKLEQTTLGDVAKAGATQFIKHKLGTTGKFVWVAKEVEHLVKPKIIAHMPSDPLPGEFLDAAGDAYEFVATKDPSEIIVLKII